MVEFSSLEYKIKALELNKTLFKNKIALIGSRKGKTSNYVIRKSIFLFYLYYFIGKCLKFHSFNSNSEKSSCNSSIGPMKAKIINKKFYEPY